MSIERDKGPWPVRSDQDIDVAHQLNALNDRIRSIAGMLTEELTMEPPRSFFRPEVRRKLAIWATEYRETISLSGYMVRMSQARTVPVYAEDLELLEQCASAAEECGVLVGATEDEG